MKTTKLFFMAALALMTAACSNDDNDFAQQPQKAEGITITAQLAPKTNGAATRAVTDQTTYIEAKWAVDEHIAILYEVSSTKYVADAKITAVNGTTGVATITFTVEAGTADNTDCTLVYPYSAAKDDKSGVKDYATLLAAQDGTLNANLDVRVGAGTIQTSTPSLTVTTQPEPQFSIFRFTLQNLSTTNVASISATKLVVSDASGNVITTVTQTPALDVMYVALPELAVGTYWLNATADDQPYIRKVNIGTATSAGKFYNSVVKMATLGDIMCSDGSVYDMQGEADAASKTSVAIIVYMGSETGDPTYKHGLAIAISDEMESGTTRKSTGWTNAKSTCEGKPAVTGGKWYMPSMDQWKTMFKANGGDESSSLGLRNTITSSAYFSPTIDPSLGNTYFWSSTEDGSDNAIQLYFYDNYTYNTESVTKGHANKFRAVLAF